MLTEKTEVPVLVKSVTDLEQATDRSSRGNDKDGNDK